MYNVPDAKYFESEFVNGDIFSPKAASCRIALIGGFTPRRCGIATFTADIYKSLATASSLWSRSKPTSVCRTTFMALDTFKILYPL